MMKRGKKQSIGIGIGSDLGGTGTKNVSRPATAAA